MKLVPKPTHAFICEAVLRLEFWILIGLAVVSVRVIVSMAPHIVLGPQFGNLTANND